MIRQRPPRIGVPASRQRGRDTRRVMPSQGDAKAYRRVTEAKLPSFMAEEIRGVGDLRRKSEIISDEIETAVAV